MLDPIAGPFCPVLTNNSSPLNRLRLAWDIGRLPADDLAPARCALLRRCLTPFASYVLSRSPCLTPSNSRPTTRQSETTRKGVACRSPSLGVALAALVAMEISAQDRKTRDRDCVAPQRLSALLVLEKPTAPRSPARLRRVAGADSQNECR